MRCLLTIVLLTGCASANMRDTYAHGDLDRDGCIAYRCQMYCLESAAPEQIAAFAVGTVDPEEAKQLKRLGGWLAGDTATTIVGLSVCEGAKELNPILGASPNPVAVIAYNGAAYLISRHDARKSPSWCSSARPIRIAANLRMVASLSNAAMAGVCQ